MISFLLFRQDVIEQANKVVGLDTAAFIVALAIIAAPTLVYFVRYLFKRFMKERDERMEERNAIIATQAEEINALREGLATQQDEERQRIEKYLVETFAGLSEVADAMKAVVETMKGLKKRIDESQKQTPE